MLVTFGGYLLFLDIVKCLMNRYDKCKRIGTESKNELSLI